MQKQKVALLADKIEQARRIKGNVGLNDFDTLFSEVSKAGLERKYANFIVCQEICDALINVCCPSSTEVATDAEADSELRLALDLFYSEIAEKWTLYPIVEGFLDYAKQKRSKEALAKGREILIRKMTADNLDLRKLGIRFKTEFPYFYGNDHIVLTCRSEYQEWLSSNPTDSVKQGVGDFYLHRSLKLFFAVKWKKKLKVLIYGSSATLAVFGYHYFLADPLVSFARENFFSLPPFSFLVVFPALLGFAIFTGIPIVAVSLLGFFVIADVYDFIKRRKDR